MGRQPIQAEKTHLLGDKRAISKYTDKRKDSKWFIISFHIMKEHILFGTRKRFVSCFWVGLPGLNQFQWSETSVGRIDELTDLHGTSNFGHYVMCKIIVVMERAYTKTKKSHQTLITQRIHESLMLVDFTKNGKNTKLYWKCPLLTLTNKLFCSLMVWMSSNRHDPSSFYKVLSICNIEKKR